MQTKYKMNFYPYSCLMMLTKEIHSNIILSTCIQNTRVYSCVIVLYTSNITTSTFSLFDFWIKLWIVKLNNSKTKGNNSNCNPQNLK